MPFKLSLALFGALLLLPGCKKSRYDLPTNPPAAAGQAELVLSLDKLNNGEISIEIEHLAPPAWIDSSLRAYVVWVQAAGKEPYKLGVMDYNEKQRSAKLKATHSAAKFTVLITLEQDPKVSAPIGVRILETKVAAPEKKPK